MAHAITFDTLAFVKKLEKAGIEQEKSEAIAQAVADVFDNVPNTIATKHDLIIIESKIDKIAAEFDSKLAKNKSDIIMWVVGLFSLQTAILALIKFIH